MATSTLQKKTDELEAIKKMKAYQAKLKTAKSEKAKSALEKKIKEINDSLKKGTNFKDLTAKQVANAKLASRKKFLEMSKKDFNAVIRILAKKSEYAFLKNMSRPEIERDIKRKAKPVGWRFKGRGDYRTPTAAQARKGRANGTVYYENRPNRSDVSQSKQLAKGGVIRATGNKGVARYELIITDEDGTTSSVYAKTKSDLMRYKKQYGYAQGGGVTPMSLAEIKAMRDAEYNYDPKVDDSDLEDDKIVRYYFEEEPQYAKQGGGIKAAAKRGVEKAKSAGDNIGDWAFNFDPKDRYNDGGEVNINELDLPVHYTMFEDEMYEYGQGGKMKK
jgi:hypothetical protein